MRRDLLACRRRNPKSEARNPKEIRNPKSEKARLGQDVASDSDFGLRISFGFRISGFGFGRKAGRKELAAPTVSS
jgi:hypothetical protein